MNEIKTRKQSINFLGFLRQSLSGLQGIPTLCYELIQNADDVKDSLGNPGASRISFDICDDALYVENDGVFREIDFTRMENVSWGNKRDEVGTTGAFGIGFISVYQITDSPEIFSSGRHWKFQPQESENQRIQENLLKTKYTRFRLPWAFETSSVRQELSIPPVRKDQLDIFAHQMVVAIESAALFLKQVRTLEVKRSGEIFRRIQIVEEADWLLLDDGEKTIKWRILEGSFDDDALGMRRKYGKLIEDKRRALVQLAIPEKPGNGLLYAFLPSETHTGLPFHINADFYPSSDRKRILLESDYKSEWNQLAIACAAETLSSHLDQVLEIFTRPVFWKFAEQVKHASDSDTLSPVFANFWENLKGPIRKTTTVLTSSDKMIAPPESVYLDTDEQIASAGILEELGICTIHPELRSFRNLLIETGACLLKLIDIADAIRTAGYDKRTELKQMPPLLCSKSGWVTLWSTLNDLWERTSYSEKHGAELALKECAIAFGSDRAIWPPAEIYQTDSHSQSLFSKFSPVVWYKPNKDANPLLEKLVPAFGLQEGLDVLSEVQDTLPGAWAEGSFSPREIYDWLENYRIEIGFNPDLQQTIRTLVIWPSAEGALKSLDKLFLAGDFIDPLHLAQLVDIEALGNRRELLERELKVANLDFVTYVRDWLPSALHSRQLTRENRFGLLKVLAENLGKLQGQNQLREFLSALPLVWCGNDLFQSAGDVYFDSKEVRSVLGKEAQLARLPTGFSEAVRALYEWLGVARSPRPDDITERVHSLVSSPPDGPSLQAIESIFGYLATQWHQWGEEMRNEFSPLRKEAWLPGSKNLQKWFDTSSVYTVFRDFLFESQANFLKIDRVIQQRDRDLIRFLGIQGEPSTEQVVKHLIFASEKGRAITQEIYVYLTQNASDPEIHQLREKACLYLKPSTGVEKYFRPDQVFWEQHPFGQYRVRLGPDFGRFKDLFDELGVKEIPDANDAITVLKEISEKYGKSNIPLEEGSDDENIVIMCWKLICNALDNEQIEPAVLKKLLGNKKTIPDSRRVLEPPVHLFFDDRPGWGQKFEIIKNSLVRPIEGAWMAMEAAGVQRLSNAVTIELHRCDDPHEDAEMAEYLLDRIPLIRRVIEAHHSKGITGFALSEIEELSFSQAEHIEIVRVFNGFGRQEQSPLESVDAVHIDGDLRFCKENGSLPWKSIAREMAYVLLPSGELSSLGMELKEILSQSVRDANLALDDYGYPRVEQAPEQIVEGPIAGPGSDMGFVGTGTEGKDESGDDDKTRKPSDEPQGNSPQKPKNKTKKNSWLMSYVYPPEENGEEKQPKPTDTDWASRRTKTANAGVAHVMKYESDKGRTPTDMETIEVHHPGYDIKSIDEKGQTRYIEVKSFSGIWDRGNPAQMTKTEFENAREFGKSYWLYIVENAETEEYRMYRICNPANRADRYLFDRGWQPLSSLDE